VSSRESANELTKRTISERNVAQVAWRNRSATLRGQRDALLVHAILAY